MKNNNVLKYAKVLLVAVGALISLASTSSAQREETHPGSGSGVKNLLNNVLHPSNTCKDSNCTKHNICDTRDGHLCHHPHGHCPHTHTAGQPTHPYETVSTVPPAPIHEYSISLDDIKRNLVAPRINADGTRDFVSQTFATPTAKYYVIYQSASWCKPCSLFTPKLVEFYNHNNTAYKNFEVIFISHDRNEEEMKNYMINANMPWSAVKLSEREKMDIMRKIRNNHISMPGIPALFIFNDKGEQVSQNSDADESLQLLKKLVNTK